MDGSTGDDRAIAAIRETIGRARTRLTEAGARDEALAELVPARRVMLITREATMVPVARVWRLGVLLLGTTDGLWATGSITRSQEPGRATYQSESAERRRGYRAAAYRGRFPAGATVNFDAPPIELDAAALAASAGPLVLDGGSALVRWNATMGPEAALPLGEYLDDRVGLLVNPPEGA